MTPEIITGATHALGAPVDWDAAKQGQCGVLHVKLVVDPDVGPEMRSAWRPSPEELAALAAGARVILNVCGEGHPPVALWVEGVGG